MIIGLAGAFGYCLLSALVIVIPAEIYIFGAGALSDVPGIWIAAAGWAGMVVGKFLYYLLGLGVLNTSKLKVRKRGKWVDRMERLEAWCREHSWGVAVAVFLSALIGLPPFALVCVLAGTLRMRWWLFVLLTFVGRFLMFWAIVAIPNLIPRGLFGL